jgi:hypothetical protein
MVKVGNPKNLKFKILKTSSIIVQILLDPIFTNDFFGIKGYIYKNILFDFFLD